MKKSVKITIAVLSLLIIATGLISGIAFAVLALKTNRINDDFSFVYTSEKYSEAVRVDNVEVIEQEISCGYAVIEMFSAWQGGDITEQTLFDRYGKIVTSTGKAFCDEFNKQFLEYGTTVYKYLKNSELIDKVYESLMKGIPVPIEWAAMYRDEWTLHYSLVIGMDIPRDIVTVANPYGFIENISLKELVDRTTFNAFENMPFFYSLGFAFGVFEKNTVFIPTKRI